MWLLNKLFAQGDQPTPRFAFQGTVNWMRGLALQAEDDYSHEALRQFYQRIQRRQPNEDGDALAFESLTMSMHNVSSIESMEQIENPYPIVRAAIIAWYYATYYAAKAMLAASSGADPQTHALTAKVWQSDIVDSGLVKKPFDLSITDITPTHVREVIGGLRNGNRHDLNTEPTDLEMAYGAIVSCLNGTAEYEQWRLEEHVKASAAYRNAGHTSFRSNAAKELRDAKLRPAQINYLVQAFRYRGKANYRDAIYLSYGWDNTERLRQFISDLGAVSCNFSLMAAHYIARRVVRADWEAYAVDIREYSQFNLPFEPTEI